jgi:hypothetical protein
MWIDGHPLPGVTAVAGNAMTNGRSTLLFAWNYQLPSQQGSSQAWLRILREPFRKQAFELSVGTLAGPPLRTAVNDFRILRVRERGVWAWVLFFAAAIYGTCKLAQTTNLLREEAGWFKPDETRAYSLARTQMMLWTFVVAMSYTFIWMVTWNQDILNGRVLVLLGVAMGTTVLGSVADSANRDKAVQIMKTSLPVKAVATVAAPPPVADPAVNDAIATLTTPKNETFLLDLVSDRNGPAVTRVQMLLFTAILAVIFIAEVYSTLVMPQFSDTLLGLMGVSSSGYLAMKVNEQKNEPPKGEPVLPLPPAPLPLPPAGQ